MAAAAAAAALVAPVGSTAGSARGGSSHVARGAAVHAAGVRGASWDRSRCAGGGARWASRAALGGTRLSLSRQPRADAPMRKSLAVQAELALVPIGDGDTDHLDESVPMPGPISIDFDNAVVGRVEEKADIVIPVATVSGQHARLEKKGSSLWVTDLDSTNGTWVGRKQIRPGAATQVSVGTSLTFGDEHLAKFKLVEAESVEE